MNSDQTSILRAVAELRFVLESNYLPVPKAFLFENESDANQIAHYFAHSEVGEGLRRSEKRTLMGIQVLALKDET